jgi:hypothetical protein
MSYNPKVLLTSFFWKMEYFFWYLTIVFWIVRILFQLYFQSGRFFEHLNYFYLSRDGGNFVELCLNLHKQD